MAARKAWEVKGLAPSLSASHSSAGRSAIPVAMRADS
jgi:hypothetical protein